MRSAQIRIGTEVLFRRQGAAGNGRKTPPRQRGLVVGFKEKGAVYTLTVQTSEGTTTVEHRHAKFSAPPKINPEARRMIWIRKDVLGVRAYNRPRDPMFLWTEPEGYQKTYYIEYPVHVSHIAGLRAREKTLSELRQEVSEVEGDLHEYLRFLKSQGAVPVDTE